MCCYQPVGILTTTGPILLPHLALPLPGRLSRRFKDPRICALLSLQDLYVGLSPYDAPGVFSLLAATELSDGVWYPMGGFQKVGARRGRVTRVSAKHKVDKSASLLRSVCRLHDHGSGQG